MKKDVENPNILHYIGLALLVLAWFSVMQLKVFEGLALVFLGCGVGLLGCEWEDIKKRR